MLARERRIRKPRDYQRVYRCGRVLRGRYLVMRVMAGDGGVTRFGLATSRRVKGAVRRNLLKRRLREICRKYQGEIGGAYDLVINIGVEAERVRFRDLERDFVRVLERSGIIDKEI